MAKKEQVIFNASLHGDKLAEIIKQCSDHKVIIESVSEAFNELRKLAADELGVNGKTFNKMFTMYHKDQRAKFEEESEEVIDIYDSVFNG